jgi:hypothetical protein
MIHLLLAICTTGISLSRNHSYSIRTKKCAAIKKCATFQTFTKVVPTHIFHLSLIKINSNMYLVQFYKRMLCDFAQIILWDFPTKGEKKSLFSYEKLNSRHQGDFFSGVFGLQNRCLCMFRTCFTFSVLLLKHCKTAKKIGSVRIFKEKSHNFTLKMQKIYFQKTFIGLKSLKTEIET